MMVFIMNPIDMVYGLDRKREDSMQLRNESCLNYTFNHQEIL